MSDSEQAAAPESGLPEQQLPPFEELAADPEIAALLEFDPAPRKNRRKDGWTPPLQKRFVAYLAYTGSPTKAAEALGKNRHGVEKVYKSDGADSFRAAWDSAVGLFIERDAERIALEHAPIAGARPPFVDSRRKRRVPMAAPGPQPGQVLNEFGEWEDEGSVQRRAEDARDSICRKLLNCRRLFLQAISGNAGKRAAFEILTELPIDWEKAERLEAQPDEPWNRANMRQPDMVLTAESGWLMGEGGYGADRKAQARKVIDELRADEGLPPIEWGAG